MYVERKYTEDELRKLTWQRKDVGQQFHRPIGYWIAYTELVYKGNGPVIAELKEKALREEAGAYALVEAPDGSNAPEFSDMEMMKRLQRRNDYLVANPDKIDLAKAEID